MNPALPHAEPTLTSDDALAPFRAPPRAATIGLLAYLAGMTFALVWLFIGYTVVRLRAPVPAGQDLMLPAAFWVGTFVVLASSLSMHWADRAARAERGRDCGRGLVATLALGLAFLGLQVVGFGALFAGARGAAPAMRSLYVLIAVMAALHAVHLGVGLARVAVVTRRVRASGPGAEAAHVAQTAIYWHYLAVAWLAMFALFTLSHGSPPPLQ